MPPIDRRIRDGCRCMGIVSGVRRLTLTLPDLGDEQKNHKLDEMLTEFAEQIARLIAEPERGRIDGEART